MSELALILFIAFGVVSLIVILLVGSFAAWQNSLS